VKKILAVLLVLLLLLSLVTACEKQTAANSGSGGNVSSKETSSASANQSREITVCLEKSDFVSDYDDNLLTDKLEGMLNCDLSFRLIPSGPNSLSEIQLMIMNGEVLPDVFAFPLGDALTYEYGSAGSFVPLNDWCNDPDVMPNLNNVVSEEDKNAMLTAATSGDGNIYALVRYEPDVKSLTPYHLYINTVWLDYLGLDVPTTSDELKDVLVAFAFDDPNGNGLQDEIPLLIDWSDAMSVAASGTDPLVPLMNMFVYTGQDLSSFTLSDDGLEVVAPQMTDAFRDGLRYFRDLYDAGAITENSFAFQGDSAAFKQKLTQPVDANGGDPVSHCTVGMFSACSIPPLFEGAASGRNRQYAEYQMISVPVGPDGVSYSPYVAPTATKCWYVTKDAENPELCARLGDCFYDPQVSLMARYGEIDVDWTDDETFCADWYREYTTMLGGAGQDNPVQDYYSLVLLRSDAILGEASDAYWYNVQPRYSTLEFSEHIIDFYDPEAFVTGSGSYGSITAQAKELYLGEQPQYLLPELTYTPEEQAIIAEYAFTWPDYLAVNLFSFMTTATATDVVTKESWEISVDDDVSWQTYLDELSTFVGVTQMVQAMQSAYERTEQYASLAAEAE